MTARAAGIRSIEVQWSGASNLVFGSETLDLINAVTEQGAVLIPFDATIKEVRSRVRTACGTAAGNDSLKGGEKGGTANASPSHATTDAAGTDLTWAIADADV